VAQADTEMRGRDTITLNPLSAYLSRKSRDDRAGDRPARSTLIERNLRLVVSVAVGYRRSGMLLEDLIQKAAAAQSRIIRVPPGQTREDGGSGPSLSRAGHLQTRRQPATA